MNKRTAGLTAVRFISLISRYGLSNYSLTVQ